MNGVLTKERFAGAYYSSFEDLNMELACRIAAYDTQFSVYRIPKLALYMLWFGIARNHLDAIRKCHLGSDYIFDPLANRKFAVPNDVMQEIISIADFTLGNPEIVVSDYVLRTRVSGRMSVSTISSAITHFNNVTGFNAQGGFQMQPVFESGLFNRVWNLEQSGYELPVYRKNRKLPEEGYEIYEHLFQRKFTSIKALSTYIVKYRDYIEYFKK